MFTEWVIVGTVGKDPVLRYTDKGMGMCTISVACNWKYGETKKTAWYHCTAFGKAAEAVNAYVLKGSKLVITATPNPDEGGAPRMWEKDGKWHASYECIIDKWRFIGDKKAEAEQEPLL